MPPIDAVSFFKGLCRPPQVEQVGVWHRARFGRLCGMMKAQDIQFDGVRMYMWCLKILASHRRSLVFFEGRIVSSTSGWTVGVADSSCCRVGSCGSMLNNMVSMTPSQILVLLH